MLLSIVIPCFNEEESLDELYLRLRKVLEENGLNYRLIFVDDGSTDKTIQKLIELRSGDKRVRVLELSRNFGHQAALCAGLDHSGGDAVIMMDADLQHPPELIPELISKWKEGHEIVYTIRKDPPGTSLFKRKTASCFYRLINLLARINIPENSADFRLLDKKVVDEFMRIKERTRFLRGLIRWVGFRQCPVCYEAAPRFAGRSKYTLWRMIRLAFDGITSFSTFPLHLATFFGSFISILGFAYALYALYVRLFTGRALPGWASMVVTVLFLGGIQLLCLGIIGEYIGRIYTESKFRPLYVLRNIYAEYAEAAIKAQAVSMAKAENRSLGGFK